MDISNRIPGADLTSLQATRQPQGVSRAGSEQAGQVAGESAEAQVTISDAGRAAEAAARGEDVAPVTTQSQPTPPVQGAAASVRADGPASATPGPATRSLESAPEALAQGGLRPEAEAGAPTAANAALELYRENQQRPDDRPPVAPIRASA